MNETVKKIFIPGLFRAAPAFLLLFLTAFIALSGPASAAIPAKLSYQGTLRKSGALFNGTSTMEFRITSADGSTVYWTSGSTDVAVTSGLFRYALGSPNEAQFSVIPWGAITPYVQMKVDGSWMPNEPLYSSAYSMYSLRAEGSEGNFTAYNGDIRISTTSGSKGIVFQDGTIQYSAVVGAGGLGNHTLTQNLIAGSFWLSGDGGNEGISINSLGKVGIGINPATVRLEVNDGDANTATSGIKFTNFACSGNDKLTADPSGNLVCASDQTGSGSGNLIDTLSQTLTAGANAGGLGMVNLGGVALGLGTAGTRLDVQAAGGDTYAQFWRNSGGTVVATMTAAGVLYADGSQLTGISVADTLGTHVATTTLNMANFGIVNVASITASGYMMMSSATVASNMGVGGTLAVTGGSTLNSVTVSSLTAGNAAGLGAPRLQLANNVAVSSETSSALGAGVTISTNVYIVGFSSAAMYYGDGSRLTGLSTSDTLGTHVATTTLNMANFGIVNVASITASGYIMMSSATVVSNMGVGGTLAVTGAAGVTAPRLQLANNVAVSSETSPALGAGITISTNVYIVGFSSAARYYGDGSQLTGVSFADTLGTHVATTTLNMANFGIVNVASITTSGYITTNSTLTVLGGAFSVGTSAFVVKQGNVGVGIAAPGAALDVQAGTANTYAVNIASNNGTGLMVVRHDGSVGIGTASPAEKLEVVGGIKIGNTSATNPGTMRWIGTAFEGYNGSSWVVLNGSYTLSMTTMTWAQGANDTIYSITTSSNVAIGSTDSGGSKLKVTGATSDNSSSALYVENAGTAALLVVRNDGNVGIGTANPDAALAVVGQIKMFDGNQASGKVLTSNAAGLASWQNAPSFADSLGSHVATTTLNMNTFNIANADYITASSATFANSVTASSFTAAGALGISAAQLRLAGNVSVALETDPALGAGVIISTNVYIVGFSSAAMYYGNGSQLTGLPTADNLGTHVATTTLNMANFGIVNVASITAGGYIMMSSATVASNMGVGGTLAVTGGSTLNSVTVSSLTAGNAAGLGAARLQLANNVAVSSETSPALGAGVNISTNVYIVGFSSAAMYYGNGSQLTGISVADTLGTHVATTTLNMANFGIVNVSSISASSLQLANNVTISSETNSALGAGVTISTNVYIIGFSSAAMYYGDGSKLTNIAVTGMANPATANLDMASKNIINTANITASVVSASTVTLSRIAVGNNAAATPRAAMYLWENFQEAVLNSQNVVTGLLSVGMANPDVTKGPGYVAMGASFIGGIAVGTPIGFDTLLGLRSTALSGTPGTVTNAMGIYVQNEQHFATVTNNYSIFVATPNVTDGGTIANNYGIYISSQSAHGTAKSYNLYSEGSTAKNHFEGLVTIGTTGAEAGTHDKPLEIKANSNAEVLRIDRNDSTTKYCIIHIEAAGSCSTGTQFAVNNLHSLCLICN